MSVRDKTVVTTTVRANNTALHIARELRDVHASARLIQVDVDDAPELPRYVRDTVTLTFERTLPEEP